MKNILKEILKKKKKIKLKTEDLIKIGIFVAIILVVIILPTLVSIIFGNHLSKNPVSLQSETSSKTDYAVYRESILQAKADGVLLYDKNGKVKWSLDTSLLTPFVNVNGNYIIASDIEGADAFVIKDGEVQYTVKENNPVIYANVNKNGYSVIITGETGYKSLVSVYDKNGTNIYKWYSGEWNISDAVLSDDNKHMAVSGVDTSGREITSVITVFNLDKEEYTGQAKLKDSLVYKLRYNNSELVVLTDNSVLSIDKKGKIKREFPLHGKTVNAFDFEDANKLTLALSDNDEKGSGNKVLVLNSKLRKIRETESEFVAETIDYSNGKILLAGKDNICMLGRSNRKIINESLNKSIEYAKLSYDGKRIVTFSAGVSNIHKISIGRW